MNDPNYYNRDVLGGPGVNVVDDRAAEEREDDELEIADTESAQAEDAETEPRIGDEDVTDEDSAAAQEAQLDADVADEDRLDTEDSALDTSDSALDEDDDEGDDDVDAEIVAEDNEDDEDDEDADVEDEDEDEDDVEDAELLASEDGEVVAVDDEADDDDEDVDAGIVAETDEDDEDDEDDADEAIAEADENVTTADDTEIFDQHDADEDDEEEVAANDVAVTDAVPAPMNPLVPVPMPMEVDEIVVPEPVADETAPVIPAQSAPADGVSASVSGGMHPGEADTVVETAPAGVDSDAFNDRMQQAQLTFIDDPRGAAEAARTLANEAIEAHIAALRSRTGQLDAWSGEEAPDTEVLRAAMRAYRDVITSLSAE